MAEQTTDLAYAPLGGAGSAAPVSSGTWFGDTFYPYTGWQPAVWTPSYVYVSVPDFTLPGRVAGLERENAELRGKVAVMEKMLAALIGKQAE